MTLTARFCAQCGHDVKTKLIEGSQRQVCVSCGTVFYQNPLPVAAAVVLNRNREVLLVKRRNEPHRGEWCLPTGFAETNETISEAAVRELREETGITGIVRRLLNAESHKSDFYGDLLFVTFEIQRVGGADMPGDDAEKLAYFPIDNIPSLAFRPHEEAVRICSILHQEDWAIADSFASLDAGAGAEMLSDALIALVEEKAEEIYGTWLDVVRANPSTKSYARIDSHKVGKWVYGTLSRFCFWLKGDRPDGEIMEFYEELGRKRKSQDFGLQEVLSALTLLRRQVWNFARQHQLLDSPLDVYRVMELGRRIVIFFDKALYHTANGYLETK